MIVHSRPSRSIPPLSARRGAAATRSIGQRTHFAGTDAFITAPRSQLATSAGSPAATATPSPVVVGEDGQQDDGLLSKIGRAIGCSLEHFGVSVARGLAGFGRQISRGIQNIVIKPFVYAAQGDFARAAKSVGRGFDRIFLQSVETLWVNALDAVGGIFGHDNGFGRVWQRGFEIAKTFSTTALNVVRDTWEMLWDIPINFGIRSSRAIHAFVEGRVGAGFENIGRAFRGLAFDVVGGPSNLVVHAVYGVGSIAGLISGRITPGRPLSNDERQALSQVFGDAVEASPVRVVEGIPIGNRPVVIGNTVYMRDRHFQDGALTNSGWDIFRHELAHVWQNQVRGGDYKYDSGGNQLFRGRDATYNLDALLQNRQPFHRLNVEQQAELLALIGDMLSTAGAIQTGGHFYRSRTYIIDTVTGAYLRGIQRAVRAGV